MCGIQSKFLCRLIKQLFADLKVDIKDDPLLLRLLVYLSSEDDVEIVLDHAPAHFYAIHISKVCCGSYDRLSKDKVIKSCSSTVNFYVYM